MTAIIGKYQIHLGWEAFAGLIFLAVTTAFTIGIKTNQFLTKLDKIESNQTAFLRRDSVRQVSVDRNTSDINQLKPAVEKLRIDVDKLQQGTEWTTETKSKSGRVSTHRYYNN